MWVWQCKKSNNLSNFVNITFFMITPSSCPAVPKNLVIKQSSLRAMDECKCLRNSITVFRMCHATVSLMNEFRGKKLNTAKKFKFQSFYFPPKSAFFGFHFLGKWEQFYSKSLISFHFLNLKNMVNSTYLWFS